MWGARPYSQVHHDHKKVGSEIGRKEKNKGHYRTETTIGLIEEDEGTGYRRPTPASTRIEGPRVPRVTYYTAADGAGGRGTS